MLPRLVMVRLELLSPKKHVDKVYYVETDGLLTEEHVASFKNGITVDDEFVAKEALLEILEAAVSGSKAKLTIHEGKFHQVKRMFQAVGKKVVFLKRLSMGTLELDPALKPGEFRPLTEAELKSIS